eukprot:352273-Chlamydomonas_euryale.AAC.1
MRGTTIRAPWSYLRTRSCAPTQTVKVRAPTQTVKVRAPTQTVKVRASAVQSSSLPHPSSRSRTAVRTSGPLHRRLPLTRANFYAYKLNPPSPPPPGAPLPTAPGQN